MESVVPSAEMRGVAQDEPVVSRSVYSCERLESGASAIADLPGNVRRKMDRHNQAEGLRFLADLPASSAPVAFFDPQYRGLMDYQDFGNEGSRQKERAALDQMSDGDIRAFLAQIGRVLAPRGHLMLWVDKFHVAEGVKPWLDGLDLQIVDMVTWDKGRMGMGYRTRRRCEYLMVIQKRALRAKGVWTLHNIPDVWVEKLDRRVDRHAHAKPPRLMRHSRLGGGAGPVQRMDSTRQEKIECWLKPREF